MIKICGITTQDALNTCIKMHVDMVGFVFYDQSSRNISIDRAEALSTLLPENIKKVAVMVNPSMQLVKSVISVIKPDYLQLDDNAGIDEIREIKKRFNNIQVIKTIYLENGLDFSCDWAEYEGVADYILFDAMPKNQLFIENADDTFNWSVLKDIEIKMPWILSGGLNKYNVQQALRSCRACNVNASSTLEITPGVKDSDLIEAFVKTVRHFKGR
ncbi:MAG: phosphoribosylanthranilate isomerase [Alphaproteobacteria bacterium]|jgi:phosphoribosylanthranilate isomerase|nr:phosphoribosylanthranilate isomerase [Candidatus Jidaibacter sp.]